MNYLLIVFIGIIGVFYYNTIGWMIESWMYNEYYSHGFIVPIVSGYIDLEYEKCSCVYGKENITGRSLGFL